jgi:hypothetical protein
MNMATIMAAGTTMVIMAIEIAMINAMITVMATGIMAGAINTGIIRRIKMERASGMMMMTVIAEITTTENNS